MHQIVRNDRARVWQECEQYRQSLAPPDPTWPPDVQAVAAYIHANLFNENLKVEQVRRACRIGDNNISGRFRYYVGRGIKEYIDSHRLSLAKRLLFRHSGTILSIALEVGYPSHSAFAMSFKRRMGCTPSMYRNHVVKGEKPSLSKAPFDITVQTTN